MQYDIWQYRKHLEHRRHMDQWWRDSGRHQFRALREAMELSQRDLKRYTGLEYSRISRLETGYCMPTLEDLNALFDLWSNQFLLIDEEEDPCTN
jgi:hypothetical protein